MFEVSIFFIFNGLDFSRLGIELLDVFSTDLTTPFLRPYSTIFFFKSCLIGPKFFF